MGRTGCPVECRLAILHKLHAVKALLLVLKLLANMEKQALYLVSQHVLHLVVDMKLLLGHKNAACLSLYQSTAIPSKTAP